MAVREGRWDCIYCEARAIKGRHLLCPHCNRTRPAGIKFYLPENEAAIEEEFLIERANTGPDWICPFCESSNPNNADVCQRCMAPRGEEVTVQSIQKYSLDEVAREGDMAALEKAAYGAAEARPAPAPAPKKGRSRRQLLVLAGLLFAFLCLCASIAFFALRGSETTATVVEANWQQTVAVEAFGTVIEEGWSLPAGGRLIEERSEIRSYEQVRVGTEYVDRQVSEQVQVGEREYVCGQEDMGNGFFQDIYCSEPIYETQYRTETVEEPIYEDQPIYDTYYVFEIDTWSSVRTETASGSDFNLYWPETSLADGEREGPRQGRYILIFEAEDGQQYEFEMAEAEWRQYDIGDAVNLELNSLGEVTAVTR